MSFLLFKTQPQRKGRRNLKALQFGKLCFRKSFESSWSSWRELWHTGNFEPGNYSLLGHNHDALYAALSHNHSAAHITSGTLSVSRGGTGAGTLTGYVKGNGTSAFTASATIPWSVLSGVPQNITDISSIALNRIVYGDNSHKSMYMAGADLNTYSASGFYHTGGGAANRPDSNWDTLLFHISSSTGFYEGQIAIVPTATEGKLCFRKSFESSWSSWRELWHTGNFEPGNYSLLGHNHDALYAALSHNHSAAHITSGTLSVSRGGTGAGTLAGYVKGNGTAAFTATASVPWGDLSGVPGAFAPVTHASTHLYNGGDAITGEASFGLRSVSISDAWSVGGALGYGGIGVISNSGTWRQAITFTDAGADSHPVFSIITSKNTGSTWSNVFSVSSSGIISCGNINSRGTISADGSLTIGGGNAVTKVRKLTGNLDSNGTKTIALGSGKGAVSCVINGKFKRGPVSSTEYYFLGRFITAIIDGDNLKILTHDSSVGFYFDDSSTYEIWILES